MRRLKAFALFLSNVVATVVLVALAGAIAWGVWQVLPDSTRSVFRDPQAAVQGAQRGVRAGPANPFTALIERVREWFAERRDLIDAVIAADGTSGGITPLPGWASADQRHVFGATETLWQSRRGKLSGARWSRVVFAWSEVQPGGPRDWRAHYYLRDDLIQRERANGIEVVGLLQATPAWAATRREDGGRAVPAGLYRDVNDPQNTWAVFVRKMASEYRGRIDTWIIWNEPDILPDGPNSQYYNWAGDERDYARLLAVASQAAKAGNPRARIVFAATTYWVDQNAGRPLFLDRVLAILAAEPPVPGAWPFDAVALNLYSSPDDLRRVGAIYREVLDRHGVGVPLWLTETNATPYDDPARGLARPPNGIRVTMDQQSSFVLQAMAMGLTAGYERLAIHSLTDRDTTDELWGLIRNDGTLRPAFVAYQTAARYLGGADRVEFAGRERARWPWPQGGYLPNWQVYLVVVERPAGVPGAPPPGPAPDATPTPGRGLRLPWDPDPGPPQPVALGRQRVSVLWNGDAEAVQVTLPRVAERASLIDKYGRVLPLEPDGERWRVTLAGATAHSPLDPEGFYYVGGDPVLLVEDGVAEGAPVVPPEIAA
jgi:hypothetical protein